jgi:hypothetical protein
VLERAKTVRALDRSAIAIGVNQIKSEIIDLKHSKQDRCYVFFFRLYVACVSDVLTSPTCDQSMEDLCNTLLCILSLLELSEDKERDLVERFCPRLLDLCESGLISRRLLFLGFVSRRKLKLTRLLMDAEDERYKRQSGISDTLVLEGICAKLLDSSGNIQIEEMFLRTMKQGKHWIEDIVVRHRDSSELIPSVCIPYKIILHLIFRWF